MWGEMVLDQGHGQLDIDDQGAEEEGREGEDGGQGCEEGEGNGDDEKDGRDDQ